MHSEEVDADTTDKEEQNQDLCSFGSVQGMQGEVSGGLEHTTPTTVLLRI